MSFINDKIVDENEYILQVYPDQTSITVRDLQLAILPIMDEIHRICLKHHIAYGLMAGSALGIYNYGGMIPWDDDMDVFIIRKDWLHFVKVIEDELDDEFYFQCFETDDRYNVLIPSMKVRRHNTYIEESNYLLRNKCTSGDGIFVDITIFDYISENKFQDQLYRTLIRLLVFPLVLLDNLEVNPVGIKKLARRIGENYAWRNRHSRLIGEQIIIPWLPIGKESVFEIADFFPLRLYSFENREYYSFSNMEKILTQWYGPQSLKQWDGTKWIDPLPNHKRKPKHIVDINLDGPFSKIRVEQSEEETSF